VAGVPETSAADLIALMETKNENQINLEISDQIDGWRISQAKHA
tara:strand:+ start:206 stop:337 length:132 start_codon:yes stop_codon:yes gene_type:complete